MPAFTAIEEISGENSGCVVFAKSNIHARKIAASELNDGEIAGLRVHRDGGLDKYEDSGRIPLFEMIYRGWWTECTNCGVTINEDLYQDHAEGDPDGRAGEEPQGFFNGAGFCSNECEKSWHEWQEERGKITCNMRAELVGRINLYFRDAEVIDESFSIYIFPGETRTRQTKRWRQAVVSSAKISFLVPESHTNATSQYNGESFGFLLPYMDSQREKYRPYVKLEVDRFFPIP